MKEHKQRIVPQYLEKMIINFLNTVKDTEELEFYISKARAKQILRERNWKEGQKFRSLSEITMTRYDENLLSSIQVYKQRKQNKEIVDYLSLSNKEETENTKTIFISF